MIKYALRPGYVYSREDGERHYINALTLAQLYQVSLEECMVVTSMFTKIPEGVIELFPRHNGNYRIPENTKAP